MLVGATAQRFSRAELTVETADGKQTRLDADKVLVTVGRRPNTDGWGLEELDLDRDGPFLRIDDQCRTSMRGVYAIGDVTGEPMLAHRAMAQGEMVAEIVAGGDPDAPPSAGAYRPIAVSAPEGCLLNARSPAAVAAGNVETSSRVADLVIAALSGARPVPAQGQGTMNNLTLASDDFTYYETLGGGQGACPDADGPSAIHVAMSNTLNTPVEALESEFPLRVRELSLRRGSGGSGQHRGGDGIVREIEVLAPMRYSLISERRRHAPRGRDGGEDGAPGRNLHNGEPLPSKCEGDLRPGRRPRIETPGGGGHGPEST